MITNTDSGTTIDEIAPAIYRISTPVPPEQMAGGFTFNQYLLAADSPLLYHTGLRKLFPLVCEAIATVIELASLRYIGFSHYEADECGSLNDFLAVAPDAEPLCSEVAKMVSVDDVAIRPARALADGEILALGKHRVQWINTPHFPHGWECGHLFEHTTQTLFCGDLFTQGGIDHEPITTGDILESSELMRAEMDYFSHTRHSDESVAKLSSMHPKILACMHGAAWSGDGTSLLNALGERLGT